MENDFLKINESKVSLIDPVRYRIEKLFGVKVAFQNCENGEVSCVLQKKDASKSIVEAKVSRVALFTC